MQVNELQTYTDLFVQFFALAGGLMTICATVLLVWEVSLDILTQRQQRKSIRSSSERLRTVSTGLEMPLIELGHIAKDTSEESSDSMQLATYAEVCACYRVGELSDGTDMCTAS